MMRIDAQTRLFGYPAVALVLLGSAVLLGVAPVFNSLRRDRKARQPEGCSPL